jgi:hypothetical protein
LSVGHFVAKIRLRKFRADFGKNAFSHSWQLNTVTQDEYELRKAAHVFGWWWGRWREDQHMWDGQELKDPCFFKLILVSQIIEEAYFMRQKLGSLKR